LGCEALDGERLELSLVARLDARRLLPNQRQLWVALQPLLDIWLADNPI
jgi:hypothetical protein